MPTETIETLLAGIKPLIDRAKTLNHEDDTKVFEFPGTADQFKASLARQGIPNLSFVAAPDGAPPTFPLHILEHGLEVIEIGGWTYIGTSAALKKALPALHTRRDKPGA